MSPVLIGALVWLLAGGQAVDHDHPVSFEASMLPASELRYNLRAVVDNDSAVVAFQLDVDLRNSSGLPLDDFLWACPPGLIIDSVLYQGVPEKMSPTGDDVHTRALIPPHPLAPNAHTHFLIAGRYPVALPADKTCLPAILDDWFPRLLYPRSAATPSPTPSRHIWVADYRATIEVDSAYWIVAPGKLLNEKEHIGLVAEASPGEIQLDLLGDGQIPWGGVTFKPSFPDGNRRYHISHRHCTGLPLVITRSVVHDRLVANDLHANFYRSSDVGDDHARSILARVRSLLWFYSLWLERPLHPTVHIVCGPRLSVRSLGQGLLCLPDDHLAPDKLLLTAVALGEAFTGYAADDQSHEAILVNRYLALRAVTTTGARRYDWSDSAIPGMSDPHFRKQLKALHALAFILGEDTARALLQAALLNDDGEWSAAVDQALVGGCSGLTWSRLVDSEIDFGAELGSTGRWRLTNRSEIQLPLEVAYVAGFGDTLVDTIACRQVQSDDPPIMLSLPRNRSVRTIIVDPYYRYDDSNRTNNVLRLRPTRGRHFPPRDVFPLYNPR